MNTSDQQGEAWRDGLRLKLEQLVDGIVVEGAAQDAVFDAIVEEVESLRRALAQDPDPADTAGEQVIDEPANDWPGAER